MGFTGTITLKTWHSARNCLNLVILLFSLLLLTSHTHSASFLELGPLIHQFPLTTDPGTRTEALGPLISYELAESRRSWAFSPFFASVSDPETERLNWDFLYPLMTYDRYGPEYRWQFFQLLSFSGGQTLEEEEKDRLTLFPLFFLQQSSDPDDSYWALVPFYGRLQNRLFQDEIAFVLFPGYLRTEKNEVVTHHGLFPLFHLRRGPALRGWKAWPLAGAEHKEISKRTNTWNDVEIVPGHDKQFVLWPVFFNNYLGIGSENPEHQLLLLPLFAIQRSPERFSASYLWPVGLSYTRDRTENYRQWGAPWPLIIFARGESRTINRVWPIFSRAQTATQRTAFYLWPLYRYRHTTSPPLDRERTRILFFLYSHLVERNTVTGTARRRTDLWPLFSSEKSHDGDQKFQLLSILEPFFPGNESIEREYSPIWSLWRSKKDGASGRESQSLLWNLYRYDGDKDSKKISLLFGLFHYQSNPHGRSFRLFYVPFGQGEQADSSRNE